MESLIPLPFALVKIVMGYCRDISILSSKIQAHTKVIKCLVTLPDSIVSGSDDTTLKLWNYQGELIRTMTGHTKWVKCVCVFNNMILSGSGDCTVKVWTLSGDLIASIGFPHRVVAMCALPNGFVVGMDQGSIRVYTEKRQYNKLLARLLFTYQYNVTEFFVSSAITCLHYHNNMIIIGTRRGDMIVCSLTGEIGHRIRTNSHINCITVTLNAIIIGRGDGNVYVYTHSYELKQTLSGHTSPVTCIIAVGTEIMTGSYDKTIRVWIQHILGEYQYSHTLTNTRVACMTLTPCGMMCGTYDGALHVWV